MTTLFQLYANVDTLKHNTRQMAQLWHRGDQILLMGDCAMLTDWLCAYISDINIAYENDESLGSGIKEISNLFVLKADIDQMNDSATSTIDYTQFSPATINVIDDTAWVEVTQSVDRVVTIY